VTVTGRGVRPRHRRRRQAVSPTIREVDHRRPLRRTLLGPGGRCRVRSLGLPSPPSPAGSRDETPRRGLRSLDNRASRPGPAGLRGPFRCGTPPGTRTQNLRIKSPERASPAGTGWCLFVEMTGKTGVGCAR